MQKWIVTLERDEDGWYIVECPAIPGCVSQGRTEEEALKNIKDAIVECLKVRVQEGLPPSIEIRICALRAAVAENVTAPWHEKEG
jgi:predicted RNase H-like HicB family nuclease